MPHHGHASRTAIIAGVGRAMVRGSLLAMIWKAYMEQPGAPKAASRAPITNPLGQARPRHLLDKVPRFRCLKRRPRSVTFRLARGSICSFRASDCTYQSYWGATILRALSTASDCRKAPSRLSPRN